MIPDPLHPALVHIPLALAMLMPLIAVLLLVAQYKKLFPPMTWLVVVVLQGILAVSALTAARTGEDEEDRVATVVEAQFIDEHEVRANWFVRACFLNLLIAAAGLLDKKLGLVGRYGYLAVSLGILALGLNVGHTGGQLIYEHGGASVYVTPK